MADAPTNKSTRSDTVRNKWAQMDPEERARRGAAFSAAARARWARMTPEERAYHIERAAQGRRGSTSQAEQIARSKYRAAGVPQEEADYLMTLPTSERKAARLRQRDYGLSPLQYRDLVARQNGLCALCEAPITGKDCHVDHDHQQGWVRGLLCASCNLSVGHIEAKGVAWAGRVFGYITTRRGPGGVGGWDAPIHEDDRRD